MAPHWLQTDQSQQPPHNEIRGYSLYLLPQGGCCEEPGSALCRLTWKCLQHRQVAAWEEEVVPEMEHPGGRQEPWASPEGLGLLPVGQAYPPLPRPSVVLLLVLTRAAAGEGGAGENGGNGVPRDPQGTMLEEGEKPMLTAGREGGGGGWGGRCFSLCADPEAVSSPVLKVELPATWSHFPGPVTEHLGRGVLLPGWEQASSLPSDSTLGF